MTVAAESLTLDPRAAECRQCGLIENDYAINLARAANGRLFCLTCLTEQIQTIPGQPERDALRPEVLYLCKTEDIYGSPPEVWAKFPTA